MFLTDNLICVLQGMDGSRYFIQSDSCGVFHPGLLAFSSPWLQCPTLCFTGVHCNKFRHCNLVLLACIQSTHVPLWEALQNLKGRPHYLGLTTLIYFSWFSSCTSRLLQLCQEKHRVRRHRVDHVKMLRVATNVMILGSISASCTYKFSFHQGIWLLISIFMATGVITCLRCKDTKCAQAETMLTNVRWGSPQMWWYWVP